MDILDEFDPDDGPGTPRPFSNSVRMDIIDQLYHEALNETGVLGSDADESPDSIVSKTSQKTTLTHKLKDPSLSPVEVAKSKISLLIERYEKLRREGAHSAAGFEATLGFCETKERVAEADKSLQESIAGTDAGHVSSFVSDLASSVLHQ